MSISNSNLAIAFRSLDDDTIAEAIRLLGARAPSALLMRAGVIALGLDPTTDMDGVPAPAAGKVTPNVGTPRRGPIPTAKAAESAARREKDKATSAPKSRGTKRPSEQMEADADRVLQWLTTHPHSNSEAIQAGTGMPKVAVALPLRKLLAAGKIGKTGEKRATRYHVAGQDAADDSDDAPESAPAPARTRANGAARRVVLDREAIGADAE